MLRRVSQSDAMKSILTLEEYRFYHPSTALVPTITQQGLIGPILERQRRRVLRSLRRRAVLDSLLTHVADLLRAASRIITFRSRAPFRGDEVPVTKVF